MPLREIIGRKFAIRVETILQSPTQVFWVAPIQLAVAERESLLSSRRSVLELSKKGHGADLENCADRSNVPIVQFLALRACQLLADAAAQELHLNSGE
jgi:hypothetical protein